MENDKIEYGIPNKISEEMSGIKPAKVGEDYIIDASGNKVPLKADYGIAFDSSIKISSNEPIMHSSLHNNDDLDYGIPSVPYSSSNNEETNSIEEKRKNIEIELSKTIEYTFGKINYSSDEIIERLKKTVDILEDTYSNSPDIIEKLVGGELNKDAIYMGSNREVSSFPLYFLIDLIIKTTTKFHIDKFNNKEEILTTLAKLQLLREKTTNLKYDNIFNPNEPLNEKTINDIINSKGDFRRCIETEEGIDFLGIIIDGNNQSVVYKNGDYYVDGETKYWSSKPTPLYQKDQISINEKILEKVKIKTERLNKVVGKYFIEGKIPFSSEFHSKLIDKEIDSSISQILFSISLIKDKNPYYDGSVAILAATKVDELENLEKVILATKQIEEKEKRTTAIEEAKTRYNSKSFLWKLVNKKTNPLNIDFNSMNTLEIEGLYKR